MGNSEYFYETCFLGIRFKSLLLGRSRRNSTPFYFRV